MHWFASNAKNIKIAGIALIPVILYSIPKDFIFQGNFPICLSKNLFGVECYGCGTSRAVFSLLYFDFSEAWGYNKLIVIIFPLLVYIWLKNLLLAIKKQTGNTFPK